MRIVVKRIPIEITDLGMELYAQIEIEEILLKSYPPIQKTILKFITDFTVPRFGNYSIKIKNDDAVIKCYVGNTLGTFIQEDAGERTVAEWHKVITRSEKHGRDNPLCCEIISHCQKANKIKDEAEAEANRKIAESLTPELIEKQKIDKWNGEVPKIQGNNTSTIVDTRDMTADENAE